MEAAAPHQRVENRWNPVLEGVDHIQLPVPDVHDAVAWYTRHLGFRVVFQCEDLATLALPHGPALMLHQTPRPTRVSWTAADDSPMPAFLFHTRAIHRLKGILDDSGATVRKAIGSGCSPDPRCFITLARGSGV